VILCSDAFVKLSATGQMSPICSVKSFGAAARGYLRSEGVCSVLLKPLTQAEADGDPIYATILHSAVNYNGRQGTSIAAPSVSRHSALIQRCYREAGVPAQRVGYIEAQGMGNPVSDIAEWDAFNHALEALSAEQGQKLVAGQCRVSTLKPMAGHMHAASALASLMKVIRSLQTSTIHPILDFTEPNPALDVVDRPCALAVERQAWPAQERLRLAGIHSHGSGGNNAHLLIQEYRGARPAAAEPQREVLPVSGRSPERLREQLRSLAAEVERHPDWSLGAIAQTLQTGRDELPDRVAFVADSRQAWLGQVRAHLDGKAADGVFEGGATSVAAPERVEPEALAREWARGGAVQWPRHGRGPRLHLPGLQLQTADYWFEEQAGAGAPRALPPTASPPGAPSAGEGPVHGTMERVVQQVLEQMLYDRGGNVDLETRFDRLGFDSLMVLRLCERVRAATGIGVEPAVLFELATPRAVVEHLTRLGSGERAGAAAPARFEPGPASPGREPIAVIGLAGRYPQARSVRELWSNLTASKDCTGAAPPGRGGESRRAVRAGWLDGVHEFDPLFFHLSPAEARFMHPKERLFMQCAWHAVEDAGYTPRSLEREVVGVYVGVSKAGLDAYKDSFFSVANRVSYRMNFSGPSMPVDTACSASLSAVHEACLHLQTGECTVALVGGVNAYTDASTFEEFARLKIMSQDGKTRTFGAGASGFVPGEGVGCVLLKPLRRAIEDGDHVYGVILGTAVNHGGRVNGYTVPSPLAQRNLIRLAMRRANVHARDIGYVEAHGTGTPLGDPIEVRGLTEAFRDDTDERGFCALGSIKTNIGHLEAAAGIAGLTKVLLQLGHRTFVPSLHSSELNAHIDFGSSPFQVPQQTADWPAREAGGRTLPRLASVSSFGAGGSNAHAVVQEYVETAALAATAAPVASDALFVLSAQSEAALRRYVELMCAHLASSEVDDLADLTFTAQVGREAMEWRLACIARDRESLLRALRSYLSSGRAPGLLLGRAAGARARVTAFSVDPDARELLRSWFQQGKLHYLAELWVNGEELDWDALHAGQRRRRVSLPAYPFEREPIPPAELDKALADAVAPAAPAAADDTARTLLLAPAWRHLPAEPLGDGEPGGSIIILCGDGLPRPHAPHDRIELPGGDIAARYNAAVHGVFRAIKRFLASKPRAPRRLQLVVPHDGEQRWLSGLGGLARTACLENANCRAQMIEVDSGISATELDDILAREAASAPAERVRYGNGTRYVLEWEERRAEPSAELSLREGGVYLITGGAGGLGRIFARAIFDRAPNATVVLVGRSALDPERSAAIEALCGPGRRVTYRQIDLTDEAATVRLMSAIRSELGGLHGILHCAGVIRDAHIIRKTEAEIAEVLAPKVTGTVLLDRASAEFELDFFVMFSSAAGVFGHAGQADYAAASAFQDGYAQYREELRRTGRRTGRTLAIDWGLWQHGGMTIGKEYQELLRASSGMVPLPTDAGISSLARCLASGLDQVAVVHVDPSRWSAGRARGAERPSPGPSVQAKDPPQPSVLSLVIGAAAEQLGVAASDLDVDIAYDECGIDRAALHGIFEKLSDRHGLAIDAELFREASTLRALSDQLWAGQRAELRRRGLGPAAPERAAPDAAAASPVAPATLRERVVEQVKRGVALVLELAPERVRLDMPFEQYGIDSLKALQITTELEKAFGPLPKTLFFEHQKLHELTEYLLDAHRGALEAWVGAGVTHAASAPGPAMAPADIRPVNAGAGSDAAPLDIAVIGLAGRYPQARNLDELWRVLSEGRDCITPIPASRWDHSRYFDPDKDKPGKTYTRWGGFLDSVDAFDAAFFNISPREAQIMEPQERLFLEVAHEAIETAGYSRQTLARQSVLNGQPGAVGVFVGVTYEEYQLYAAEQTAQGRPMVLSMSPASIANRVSYFCNFHGPSLSVDTMCASSLTTIHLACQSLRSRECSVAIAGGVNVSIHPAKYLMLGYGRFASTSGRCESFGAGGDGYVPSEGVGAVVLKPLEQAVADGDRIYGVIKASAINHGGKTNGYSVPNPKAQTAVVGLSLRQSGIAARAVSYVEAHGTGTALGDPIEVAALNKAFGEHTGDRHFCAIGSIKSNVGHCESAAGIAGFTKVLLQMKHATLVPSLHADTLNPNLELSRSPFVVQRELAPWRRPVIDGKEHPRVAGVSSFGAGGSNAHILVEEWVAGPAPRATTAGTPCLFVLSAKNVERLREYARRVIELLKREPWDDAELTDLAYTLQTGREAMAERIAAIVRDRTDLLRRLEAFVADPETDLVSRGHASETGGMAAEAPGEEVSARTRQWCRSGEYATLLAHWVRGSQVDWQVLHADGPRPRRIALPT
jgi:polyketide synthase PksL